VRHFGHLSIWPAALAFAFRDCPHPGHFSRNSSATLALTEKTHTQFTTSGGAYRMVPTCKYGRDHFSRFFCLFEQRNNEQRGQQGGTTGHTSLSSGLSTPWSLNRLPLVTALASLSPLLARPLSRVHHRHQPKAVWSGYPAFSRHACSQFTLKERRAAEEKLRNHRP
jgi:hypothetical protein